ncbi:AAA family ATPase [Campylobacter upsaliensis]|nr:MULTISPECIES: AAA family ATPase [Campylobacter]MCR2066121.1 AAA family ATPase [Campylobacter helveticus]MCR2122565.1 AAA family ATPase [Campylobacter upsaliensis]TNB54184.1 hypothetical protein FDW47_08885 [Campylobacter helveticus]TNB56678.1 hypothetical protein FDW44_07915 [Campylobacter helveticus]TNB59097.1 hypothetical protein FDR72_08850 [Campylobacter helveticus]
MLKNEETLTIKHFGPIVEAQISLRAFTVFIGESGSGKSIVLKLLSLMRWILKKQYLKDFAKNAGQKDFYRFRIETMLRASGLDENFVKTDTYVEYQNRYKKITFFKKDKKITLNIANEQKAEGLFLEKISFITDDRFGIAMLLNNQMRNSSMPYHLQKTYEDFITSFENLSDSKKIHIQTFDIELLKARYGISQRFFIKDKEALIQFHNSSSGMKSSSIIEIIIAYFSTIYDEEDDFGRFMVELFLKTKFNNPNDFLKKIPVISKKSFRLNFFIEEPELSLFPNAQKKLIEFLSEKFNGKKETHIIFSTHSPYVLSVLNCLLKAHLLSTQSKALEKKVEKVIPKKNWLSADNFQAFKIKDGYIQSIIDEETNLILADEIDEVSDEIGSIFDDLLDLEFE